MPVDDSGAGPVQAIHPILGRQAVLCAQWMRTRACTHACKHARTHVHAHTPQLAGQRCEHLCVPDRHLQQQGPLSERGAHLNAVLDEEGLGAAQRISTSTTPDVMYTMCVPARRAHKQKCGHHARACKKHANHLRGWEGAEQWLL